MTTAVPATPATTAEGEADKIGKTKETLPIWVIAAALAVANVVGVFFHI